MRETCCCGVMRHVASRNSGPLEPVIGEAAPAPTLTGTVGNGGEMRQETRVLLTGRDSGRLQIEYLVITYDEENKNAVLSLRQAEILNALANDAQLRKAGGGVPEMQETGTTLVSPFAF